MHKKKKRLYSRFFLDHVSPITPDHPHGREEFHQYQCNLRANTCTTAVDLMISEPL